MLVCKKFESRIKGLHTYNPTWVTGSKYIKKDSLQKHIAAESHIMALNLEKKESLSSSSYSDHVVQNTAIGRGLVKMANKNKDILKVCFNTAYFITKYEKPFSDYVNLIHLQQKNGVQKFSSYVNDRSAANFVDVIAKL